MKHGAIRRLENDASLMGLLAQGDTSALPAACHDMFRFEQAHA